MPLHKRDISGLCQTLCLTTCLYVSRDAVHQAPMGLYSRRDDGCNSEFHQGTTVGSENDTHPVERICRDLTSVACALR